MFKTGRGKLPLGSKYLTIIKSIQLFIRFFQLFITLCPLAIFQAQSSETYLM